MDINKIKTADIATLSGDALANVITSCNENIRILDRRGYLNAPDRFFRRKLLTLRYAATKQLEARHMEQAR